MAPYGPSVAKVPVVKTEATWTHSGDTAQADMGLVRRLQQGDRSAYAYLSQRFGAAIHGFAVSRLAGDEELAEEIMVQTLADAVRNIGRFNGRKSTLSAWVYGIARRQIQVERRRQRRRKSVPFSAQVSIDAMAEVAAEDDMATGLALRLDAQRKVAELARFLSDIEMEVLILHFADEFSVKEIGRMVGRSERAIESVLYRAKQKARGRLAKDAQ